jgi:hypothetical protein
MGNDILSSDMLVGGLVRSMYNGFQFKDYVEGCWAMYDLNEFLKGFGGYEEVDQDNGNGQIVKVKSAKMAIDDMPAPEYQPSDIRGKHSPDDYFIGYRRMYAGLLMKAVGIYQRTMIDTVKGQN